MVVNKWLNRTTEVVEAVLRHYTEHVNTPAKFVCPVLLESKYLPPANCSNKRFNFRICMFEYGSEVGVTLKQRPCCSSFIA